MLFRSFWLWRRPLWRSFWYQRGVVIPLVLASGLVAVTWLEIWLMLPPITEAVVMRYSIYVGINWLGGPTALYLLPAFSTVSLVINVLLAYALGRTSSLKYLLLWPSVGISLGFAWLGFLIVRFNS